MFLVKKISLKWFFLLVCIFFVFINWFVCTEMLQEKLTKCVLDGTRNVDIQLSPTDKAEEVIRNIVNFVRYYPVSFDTVNLVLEVDLISQDQDMDALRMLVQSYAREFQAACQREPAPPPSSKSMAGLKIEDDLNNAIVQCLFQPFKLKYLLSDILNKKIIEYLTTYKANLGKSNLPLIQHIVINESGKIANIPPTASEVIIVFVGSGNKPIPRFYHFLKIQGSHPWTKYELYGVVMRANNDKYAAAVLYSGEGKNQLWYYCEKQTTEPISKEDFTNFTETGVYKNKGNSFYPFMLFYYVLPTKATYHGPDPNSQNWSSFETLDNLSSPQ